MAKKTKKRFYKITMNADTEQHNVTLILSPNVTGEDQEAIQTYLNVLIAGTNIGLKVLLQDVPLLRPATKEERDAHVYIFKDQEKDNRIYNHRKALYHSIKNSFDEILSALFIDVEYVEGSLLYQQETVTEMSPDEAVEHQFNIAEIAKHVRESKDDTDAS